MLAMKMNENSARRHVANTRGPDARFRLLIRPPVLSAVPDPSSDRGADSGADVA